MVDTSAGGLLVPVDIIRPLVDTSAGELLIPEDIMRPKFRYLSWWTISPRGLVSGQCFDTSPGGLLVPEDIIRPLFRYLCWWTISPRRYYPPNISIPQLVDY